VPWEDYNRTIHNCSAGSALARVYEYVRRPWFRAALGGRIADRPMATELGCPLAGAQGRVNISTAAVCQPARNATLQTVAARTATSFPALSRPHSPL
jgi:hypothetical protein